MDLNHRPFRPKRNALPDCAKPRKRAPLEGCKLERATTTLSNRVVLGSAALHSLALPVRRISSLSTTQLNCEEVYVTFYAAGLACPERTPYGGLSSHGIPFTLNVAFAHRICLS